MMRNDYRRSLILLRSVRGGDSGHVRLERRTLTGSMNFLVQTSSTQRLEAALVGAGRNGYFACPLGELRRDSRGQAALNYTFDPRSICGRELEDYAILAVSEVSARDCGVLLFGNVNGHSEIDWRQARAALCRLYGAETQPSRTTETVPPRMPEAPQTTKPPRTTETVPPQTMETVPPQTTEAPQTPEAPPEPTESEPAQDVEPAQISGTGIPSETAEEIEPAEPEETPPRAGDLLDLDMETPWPDSVETLRQRFRENPPAEPAPDGDFVYISAPMPAESGYGEILAGIRVEGGAPTAVRYALPAPWSAEAPAGLEDSVWAGDSNRGWWVTEAEL